jgi:MFS family permease
MRHISAVAAGGAPMTVVQDASAGRALLIAGAAVMALSLGVRHAFGLFLDPVSMANGWGRETFALAMAVQNLAWGLAQPFAGVAADRWGAARVIAAGALLLVAGLALMTLPLGPVAFMLTAGVLIGAGQAGTTFPVVFGAVSRVLPPERRSMAFGVAMSVGSFGQFVMLPLALTLIDGVGWAQALLWFSALSALILPLALAFRARGEATPLAEPAMGAGAALRLAAGSRDFWLLSAGFFVCGFQVVMIAVHLPAFLGDRGMPVAVGTTALALVGLFNIVGTLGAGWLGGRWWRPGLLAALYFGRAIAIALFAFAAVTPVSAYAFAIAMGVLWLSTVPLTNGAVANMFGVRNMSMLGGIVFLAHQVGAFLGGWLGGAIYDRTGSYDAAWAVSIGLGVLAALLNLPIRDRAVAPRGAVA